MTESDNYSPKDYQAKERTLHRDSGQKQACVKTPQWLRCWGQQVSCADETMLKSSLSYKTLRKGSEILKEGCLQLCKVTQEERFFIFCHKVREVNGINTVFIYACDCPTRHAAE